MDFKKSTSMFLAFLLLVSNIGLAFNVHYCGGQIAAVTSIYSSEEVCEMPVLTEKACCAAADVDHKSCCKDKVVDLQDKSDDSIVKSFSFSVDAFFPSVQWHQFAVSYHPELLSDNTASYYCDTHSPPLFKLYSQYIFYA